MVDSSVDSETLNLLHRIAIANRDFVIRRRFFVADCLDVYGNAKRRAHFVLTPIETTDGCRVVIDRVPPPTLGQR